DRWPTMDALLGQLEQLLRPPRRLRWGAAAATLVVGFSAGALAVAEFQDDPCLDAYAALEGTWGPADKNAVETAFLASGHAEAPQLWRRVEAELDDYTRAWETLYQQSCQANAASQTLEPPFEQRVRCLRRHQGRLRATVDALAQVSSAPEAFDHAVLPFKLPVIESCADPHAIDSTLSLPVEPELQARVEHLRRKIDQANTLAEAGMLPAAIDQARVVVEEARGADHPPVLAEALEALGRFQSLGVSGRDAESTLQEAIMVAASAKSDIIAARAWTSLIHAVTIQDQLDRAASLRFAATAAVDRSGDEVARGWLLNNLGILYGQRREYEQARAYLERALAVKQSMLGPEHLDVGIAWFNLGNALNGDDRLDEARDAFERARSIFVQTVGSSHPHVAFVETGLGHVRRTEGRLAQAAVHYRQALEISERARGPNDLRVAKSLQYLGEVQAEAKQLDEAARHLERARKIYERVMGPDTAQVGVCLVSLSNVERARGRRAQARVLAERAMALLDDGFPLDEARARLALAHALEDLPDQRAHARALAQQALEDLPTADRPDVETWLAKHPAEDAATAAAAAADAALAAPAETLPHAR
ncbi:MAG: tetratricopeptide repeat protein, partial [Myxococcales bacterium]|nr:tetratricopeptide repeat protein [Myxococcales bacterium]